MTTPAAGDYIVTDDFSDTLDDHEDRISVLETDDAAHASRLTALEANPIGFTLYSPGISVSSKTLGLPNLTVVRNPTALWSAVSDGSFSTPSAGLWTGTIAGKIGDSGVPDRFFVQFVIGGIIYRDSAGLIGDDGSPATSDLASSLTFSGYIPAGTTVTPQVYQSNDGDSIYGIDIAVDFWRTKEFSV